MPLPTPKKNEKQSEFVGRCMSELNEKTEFKDNKQRSAVCYSQWKKSKKKSKSEEESDRDIAKKLIASLLKKEED